MSGLIKKLKPALWAKGLTANAKNAFSKCTFWVKILFMLNEYLKATKDIFLPSLCFYCEKKTNNGYLCSACKDKIEFLYPPLCRFCSNPIANNKSGLCKECFGKTFPYERLICITSYKEPIISLIHFFKYRNYDCLANLLSSFMIEHLLKIGFSYSYYDTVTSVPMHSAKLRDRGYNQSALLAKSFANYFKIAFKNDIIYELRQRVSQTRLDITKRQENIRGIFYVKENMAGVKIILIDDIFTTGATAKECAYALKEKGAIVTVIALSKTQ
jgi:ComF family protein